MKKIAFRWIDRYLVHVKIQENFLILFFAPLLAIIIISYFLIDAADNQQSRLLQEESNTISALIASSNLSDSELSSIMSGSHFQLNGSGASNIQLVVKEQPGLLSELSSLQLIIIASSGLFIGLCLYYIMTFMGGALYEMYAALKRLADGDLTARIGYDPARNDFNLIAQIIDQVSHREHQLVKATQDALALVQEISQGLVQRGSESERLANQQRDHVDSLVSATQQMTQSIREVASHAQDTSGQTQEATKISSDGLSQVNSTLTTINQLSTEINSAAGAVNELDSNALQINEMVATINAISEQTNLLALNAAIEAARAGEQGRGFAVVADEVRTLAGRTQSATVEIQQKIGALQENSKRLLEVTQKTVNNAQVSEQMMGSVSQEIGLISEKNQYISDRSIEIAAAAEEQGVVSDSITNDVEHVRVQSLKVVDMVTESANEVLRLNKQTKVLETLMADLVV